MKKQRTPKKSSFLSQTIALMILFGIAASILDFLSPILPFLIGAFIIGAIAYICIKFSKNTQPESEPTNLYSPSTETTRIKNESIRRQMEILTESTELVNSSNNLDTVLRRYDIVCNTLNKLLSYTDDELKTAGFVLKEPLSHTKDMLQNNKVQIINQAIERNINHEITSLKTVNGKLKKLDTLYNSMKENKALEASNLSFLENLCREMKKTLSPKQEETLPSPTIVSYPTNLNSSEIPNILPEIFDLVWFGDGVYKNYTPSVKEKTGSEFNIVVFPSNTYEEPSVIYLELPIANPLENVMVERPPYYPAYKDLSPEQRWLYWKFLSNPFMPQNDVGYAFLFYYGLERHLALGKPDKAFNVTLKLRNVYSNNSFQNYTARALTLTCIVKQRPDLAFLFLSSYEQNKDTCIPMKYLLILKYTFHFPLTVSEIIRNHGYFRFDNNRYIKNQPDLFSKTLSDIIHRDFQADAIDLNLHFPIDMHSLPAQQERIFANSSLINFESPVPIYDSEPLISKVSSLLNETHETVKLQLRNLRK